ncbi:MAG TPA: acyl-CoA desaturase [Marmoricola sp.]|nr:acyl-CoA desaturase [Marmoricola sp.]
MTIAATKLTPTQLKTFGDELDAIRRRVIADLGEEDRAYIHDIVRKQRKFEVAGRALMYVPVLGWLPAVTCLSISKILDNMEIGHNVMHGQYDWMGDPALNSRMFDWDTACPGEQWKYSHNYIHHTYTNVLDMDRDIGYGILRMDEAQKWRPYYLGNPLYALGLMTFFQYGVALHDLEVEEIFAGRKTWAETKHLHKGLIRKLRKQTVKDYVLFPILTGPLFPLTFLGNMTANLVRNVWAFNIIFCGHFPAGTESFTIEECQDGEQADGNGWNESRGHWYYRQILGSANITGGKTFHMMSGNLSHQIEHHLFPDIPARRYPEMSVEIQEICERYGIPYNTGRLSKQLWTVAAKIFKLSLPTKPAKDEVEPAIVEGALAA